MLDVVLALLVGCIGLGGAAQAQTAPRPQPAANAGGPAWSALTPAQQSALAPLKKDWQTIDVTRKQKWLEIAARMPSMPPGERQRVQERMTEWARMTPEERRALANNAKSVPKASTASVRTPAGEPSGAATTASVQKNNIVTAPASKAVAKTVAPTVVQAKPGASTTLISKTASPPAHAQIGQPKIAAGQDKVNRSTLLPKAGPQSAAAAASAAQ